MTIQFEQLKQRLKQDQLRQLGGLSLNDFSEPIQIGGGGQGRVYLTQFNGTTEQVIIKGSTPDEDHPIMFILREIDVHRNLSFRFLTEYIGSFQQIDPQLNKQCYYIVMKYYPNKSLTQLIEAQIVSRSYVEEDFAWNILSQMVMAIHYLHSINVLHKDLKPDNIMLTGDNEVRVGDFGYARFMDPTRSYVTTLKGTPDCASPELLLTGQFRKISDVWGIGITTYMLLTLTNPFTV
ncbi:MAG: putative CAMK family protein kinase [Streblomastix strix]|uniref:non-specific serine/threonine protein kinase n=1 Tax=Streblomastix strix TaxID=222440 RepID=A0A5J4U833_9EUKA|nr:MAG: putative CAMK family protein kinase [Streblomastix strix]